MLKDLRTTLPAAASSLSYCRKYCLLDFLCTTAVQSFSHEHIQCLIMLSFSALLLVQPCNAYQACRAPLELGSQQALKVLSDVCLPFFQKVLFLDSSSSLALYGIECSLHSLLLSPSCILDCSTAVMPWSSQVYHWTSRQRRFLCSCCCWIRSVCACQRSMRSHMMSSPGYAMRSYARSSTQAGVGRGSQLASADHCFNVQQNGSL